MSDIIRLIKPFVTFRIKGPYVEKIINMAENARQIRRIDGETAELTMDVAAYRKIRDWCRKNGYKTRITGKHGLPFRTYFLRRRYGLLMGIFVLAFVLHLLTSRIWTMSVTSDRADEMRVYEIAGEYGINIGAKKSDLDIQAINLAVMKNYPELQYFNVNFYGCHGEIVVKQRDNIKKVIDETESCDIVSDKDGIVEKVIVRDGTAVVTEGQTVIRGDTLIKGEISIDKNETSEIRKIHGAGEVVLRTWKRASEIIPRYFSLKNYTGRETKRYTIIIGNKGFPLYFLEKNPYVCYDKRYKVSYFTLFDNIRFPVGLTCETFMEAEYKNAVYEVSEEELRKEMQSSFLIRYSDVDIEKESFTAEEKGDYILAKYEAQCLEKAGVEAET